MQKCQAECDTEHWREQCKNLDIVIKELNTEKAKLEQEVEKAHKLERKKVETDSRSAGLA